MAKNKIENETFIREYIGDVFTEAEVNADKKLSASDSRMLLSQTT